MGSVAALATVIFRLVSTELLGGDFTLVPTPSIKRIMHAAEYSAVSYSPCPFGLMFFPSDHTHPINTVSMHQFS